MPPAGVLVAEAKKLRMQNLCENLQGLDDPRAGPVEILIAVGEENLAFPHRSKLRPLGLLPKRGQFGGRTLHVEATWRDHDDVRVRSDEFLEFHPRRKRSTLAAITRTS